MKRLTSNTSAASAKVVITTVQLKGEPDLDPAEEEESSFGFAGAAMA